MSLSTLSPGLTQGRTQRARENHDARVEKAQRFTSRLQQRVREERRQLGRDLGGRGDDLARAVAHLLAQGMLRQSSVPSLRAGGAKALWSNSLLRERPKGSPPARHEPWV